MLIMIWITNLWISFKWELSKSFNYLSSAYYLQNFKIPQEANMRFTHNQMAFLFLGLKRIAKEKNKLNLRYIPIGI